MKILNIKKVALLKNLEKAFKGENNSYGNNQNSGDYNNEGDDSGIYVNNYLNRKLGRVGQHYGGRKKKEKLSKEFSPMGKLKLIGGGYIIKEKHISRTHGKPTEKYIYTYKPRGGKKKIIGEFEANVIYSNYQKGKSVEDIFDTDIKNYTINDIINKKLWTTGELEHLGITLHGGQFATKDGHVVDGYELVKGGKSKLISKEEGDKLFQKEREEKENNKEVKNKVKKYLDIPFTGNNTFKRKIFENGDLIADYQDINTGKRKLIFQDSNGKRKNISEEEAVEIYNNRYKDNNKKEGKEFNGSKSKIIFNKIAKNVPEEYKKYGLDIDLDAKKEKEFASKFDDYEGMKLELQAAGLELLSDYVSNLTPNWENNKEAWSTFINGVPLVPTIQISEDGTIKTETYDGEYLMGRVFQSIQDNYWEGKQDELEKVNEENNWDYGTIGYGQFEGMDYSTNEKIKNIVESHLKDKSELDSIIDGEDEDDDYGMRRR